MRREAEDYLSQIEEGESMSVTILRTDLVAEPAIMKNGPGVVDLRAQIASEIWNAAVREDKVADVKSRLERGEIDLSPEAIAKAMLG